MQKLILHTFLGEKIYYTRIWKMSIIKNEVFKKEVHSTRRCMSHTSFKSFKETLYGDYLLRDLKGEKNTNISVDHNFNFSI